MGTTTRPAKTEYADFYNTYVSRVPDGDIVSILRSQMTESASLLERVSPERAEYRYAPGKWSVKQLVGHVYDMEWVFSSRALVFARGLAQPMPGVEQEEFAAVANHPRLSLAQIAAQWRALRAANVLFFESLDEEAWKRHGVASGNPVSVRALAYIIAGHERHHMGVLQERYLA